MSNPLLRPLRLFILTIGVMLFISFNSSTAFAQIPPSTEPGVVIKGLERKAPPRSRLEDIVTVPKPGEMEKKVSDKKIFVLKKVVLDKSDVYQAADLANTYDKYIGQQVSFADLNDIASAMTRKYRKGGYIFSRVIVPPQKINNGVVHFQAIEGRIVNVELVGKVRNDNGLIKTIADKIRNEGPANSKKIERYLLLIDDLPGIKARSFIKPSRTVGGGDMVISVEEDSFEGSASFDNRGSKYLGPFRGELVGAFNSVLGLHERTTLRAVAATQTSELKFGEITHEEQIGSEGMNINTRFAVTDSSPGGNVSSLGIEGSSRLLEISAKYPLIRSRAMNLNVVGGLSGLNSETDLLGIKTAEDHVRSLQAGGQADFTDPLLGINQVDFRASKGISVLGATDDGMGRSRANGKHDFLRMNLTATRIQDILLPDLSLFLSATGQASNDALLASEEFTVGGAGFGRAYDGGEIAGDRGYAGVAELRYGSYVDHELIRSYQLYAFMDGGRVFNKNPLVGESGDSSLVSTGVGVRFNIIHDISGFLEFASPNTRIVRSENNDKSRLFFSVLKRL